MVGRRGRINGEGKAKLDKRLINRRVSKTTLELAQSFPQPSSEAIVSLSTMTAKASYTPSGQKL